MNNYLIAIGGTGQHVALCLADYLALAHYTTSGRFPTRQDNWKIILIDADQEKTQEERSAWAHCREQVKRLSDAGVSISEAAHKPVENIEAAFGDTTTASLLTTLAGTPGVAELLLDLLFTPYQTEVRVRDGFFGEPRVASFVGGRWLRSVTADPHHDLGALAGALAASPQETRIAVAGSSAGGTGAGLLDPVRRWLMAISPQAAGSVFIDVGLEWFKIEGARNNALSTRMRHNAASCLFPFLKAGNNHRVTVWGHPTVAAAHEESDQDNTRQAVKRNLTLPWYGASALVDFFGGAKMPRDTAFAVDQVTVRSLSTPFHNLEELVESNRRVLGRLQHTLAYARAPYNGFVLPISLFSSQGRVAKLDDVDRQSFGNRVEALIEAKRDALARLDESETLNKAGRLVIAPYAIASISELNRLYAKDADPVACSQPIGDANPGKPTQGRLLPEHATPAGTAQTTAVPRGTLAAISDAERSHLNDLDLIAATRIPSLAGVRDLIGAFVGSAAVWKGVLSTGGKPTLPAVLRRPTDDRGPDWMRRWLLVLRALMAGSFQRYAIEDVPSALRIDLESAEIDVSGILLYEYRGEEYVAGYLDPDYVCIPSVGRLWESEDPLHALSEQAGGIGRLLTWVNLANKLVGKGKSPKWANLLESEFKGTNLLQTLNAGKDTVDVRWGNDKIVSLPLPADSLHGDPDKGPLDPFMRRDDDAAPPLDIIDELRRYAIGGREMYLRSDLKRAFNSGFLGSSIVNKSGESISLAGASLLGDDDLFTPVVVQLKSCPVPYSLPVRVEHSANVASCSYISVGTSLKVTLTLRNEVTSAITKTYSPDMIVNDAKSKTSLYLWPSIADQKQRGLWALITGAGNMERDVRVLTSDANLAISVVSGTTVVAFPSSVVVETEWMRLGERNRVSRTVPPPNAPTRRPRLVAIRIAIGAAASTEGGLIPYVPTPAPTADWSEESWCVDFGTSSSVVAVRRNVDEHVEGVILKITGESDSTIAALAGVGVDGKDLKWFDTWNSQGPITNVLGGEMPSYVLVIKDNQQSEPELGSDYVVDLSWRLDKWIEGSNLEIRERLKWSADPLRASYNREVLETMLQIRLRAGGRLPAVLPVTFTVPYRQVTTLDDFERAIIKALSDVKNSFGVEIKPGFLWESHALRPLVARMGKGIFVAADLGGGTLDLYAALYRESGDGNSVIAEEIIDSAKVGADYLMQSWRAGNQFPDAGAREGRRETIVYKTAIRSRKISKEQLKQANDTDYARRYWKTLRRYLTLWCEAVSTHWGEEDVKSTPITFERLGLGWDLYDRSGVTDWTESMNATAKSLGFAVRFQERSSTANNRSRKEELAYRALTRESAATVSELKNVQPNMVLGIDLKVGGQTMPAHSLLQELVPVKGGMRPADLDAAEKMLGASPATMDWALERLNNDEKHGGEIITSADVNRLRTTPLTLLAEGVIAESV
jgi:hypothetical protein